VLLRAFLAASFKHEIYAHRSALGMKYQGR
jgi:hypothetical protein